MTIDDYNIMSAIPYKEMKSITQARIQKIIDSLPVGERNMPRIVFLMKPYSWVGIKKEVDTDTQIGKSYIGQTAVQLKYVVSP